MVGANRVERTHPSCTDNPSLAQKEEGRKAGLLGAWEASSQKRKQEGCAPVC